MDKMYRSPCRTISWQHIFNEWQLEKPDVLAHDFGGATALRGYYLNGLRYKSLTIFDAVALAPWGSPFVQHVRNY